MILLISATMLFALGPTVLKLLTTRSAALGLPEGSISFCNVLFVGNLCAGLVTLLFSGPRRVARELMGLPLSTKALLLAAALISTIYPALLFTALERTTVTNVVLLSRFNGVVYVLLSFLVFRDRVRLPEAIGYGIIAVAVAVLVFAGNQGQRIGGGDLFVLLATLFFALTEIVSRKALPRVSVQAYVFFRNFVSAVIFLAIGLWLFGPEHFMDAFGAGLWGLMAGYALFAIVLAQVLWLKAVRALPAKAVANAQLANPAFSILFAFVLLGEAPKPMQWLVIAIVAVGMSLPRLWPTARPPKPMPLSIDTGLVAK